MARTGFVEANPERKNLCVAGVKAKSDRTSFEAAQVCGCFPRNLLTRVVLPNSQAILAFESWNYLAFLPQDLDGNFSTASTRIDKEASTMENNGLRRQGAALRTCIH
ncbi:MAG: hypothetical protein NVSMB6_30340 [Burkholderiaceae bacterium]